MLTSYINNNQDNWDILLGRLNLAYNSAAHSTTGYTPHELMFGRKPKIPIDLVYPDTMLEEEAVSYDEYTRELKENLIATFARVQENRDFHMDKAKLIYDRQIRPPNFDVGDLVLVKDSKTTPGKNKKLSNRWEGPYKVLANINNINYKLQKMDSRRKTVMHRNRLKRYFAYDPETEIVGKPKMKDKTTSTRGLGKRSQLIY